MRLPANRNELLIALAAADERTRPDRKRFLVSRTMGPQPGVGIVHSGFEEEFRAAEQDLEDLAAEGYLRLVPNSRGSWNFDITSEGIDRARKLELARAGIEAVTHASDARTLDWPMEIYPVLEAAGRAYSQTSPDLGTTPNAVASVLGRELNDTLDRILYELTRTGYLEPTMDADQTLAPAYFRLTEKGLQSTARWPGGESTAAAALLAALSARIDAASTPEERTRLEQARDGLLGLGKDVLSEILANVLTGRI